VRASMPDRPTRESLLELIAANPGISDVEIARTFFGPGSSPAAVNGLCRDLASNSLTIRRLGLDGLMSNWLPEAARSQA
jgi:hypothetical protein